MIWDYHNQRKQGDPSSRAPSAYSISTKNRRHMNVCCVSRVSRRSMSSSSDELSCEVLAHLSRARPGRAGHRLHVGRAACRSLWAHPKQFVRTSWPQDGRRFYSVSYDKNIQCSVRKGALKGSLKGALQRSRVEVLGHGDGQDHRDLHQQEDALLRAWGVMFQYER